MAGIGVKLNKIYNKNTLTTNIIGMGYSTMITIAPMILVIAAIMAMQVLLTSQKWDMHSANYLPVRCFIFSSFPCSVQHRLTLYYRAICPI